MGGLSQLEELIPGNTEVGYLVGLLTEELIDLRTETNGRIHRGIGRHHDDLGLREDAFEPLQGLQTVNRRLKAPAAPQVMMTLFRVNLMSVSADSCAATASLVSG